ncbi:HNH endonuclease [Vitreimonas flagellata]|uniref:HNH endonuclease n=1 Tax=Vitreimonas flagellata TaxID=2560861 RepID=UPI001EF947D3|nr:HNH endonuclease [Vitreimonas flagellata]
MAFDDINAAAILAAIKEFDDLGREQFLAKYRFGPARSYFLVHNGRRYDSKAIVGAAHGYLPEERPLTADGFSGGDATVRRLLERNGFAVEIIEPTRLSDLHRAGLAWFSDRQGAILPPPGVLEGTDLFLTTQAKAIHVPRQFSYALSVKIVPGGPYPDGDVEQDEDGRWRVLYHREEPKNRDAEIHSRNLALKRCLEHHVPVAVLRRVRGKPGTLYEIIGLGHVTAYNAPYFTIEGPASIDDRSHTGMSEFDPEGLEDQERILASVRRRLGQPAFRAALMEAYDGKCAISGCAVTQVLEAAHIVGYQGQASNHVQNGLLLRADLHTLFDLHLIRIDPHSRLVCIDASLKGTPYWDLNGATLYQPPEAARPSTMALQRRYARTR